jgi:hypothetical protein
MVKKRNKADQLDEAADLALAWAISVLNLKVGHSDPNWFKVQELKAKASQLVGTLKTRVDPGAMRGGTEDRVGALLEKRLDEHGGNGAKRPA